VSGSHQREDFFLTLRESQLSPGQPIALEKLVFPDEAALIKEEDKTLVWRLRMGGGESAVVKMYRRRGPLNEWRGRIRQFRVQREFSALNVLAAAGVPCSAPLLWGFGSAAEQGHFEILVTREIPCARNLKEILTATGQTLNSSHCLPLFEVIRRAHRCGVYHGALWPKNILVSNASPQEPGFHLIDMARSVRFPRDIGATRMARFDLLSLLYSLARLCPDFDAKAMLQSYGMPAAEAQETAKQSGQYHSSRHLRNRLTLEFQARAWLARLGMR